jgi:hypothetical protein
VFKPHQAVLLLELVKAACEVARSDLLKDCPHRLRFLARAAALKTQLHLHERKLALGVETLCFPIFSVTSTCSSS